MGRPSSASLIRTDLNCPAAIRNDIHSACMEGNLFLLCFGDTFIDKLSGEAVNT